jgi:NADH:ubiquinone oxidoreductase subunit F (NADH-binding)
MKKRNNNLIAKIKKAGLTGRGGAGYPTALKWQEVQKARGQKKYVICNASEGELGLSKDFHILKNYPEKVLGGMVLALDYIGAKEGFMNLNKRYFQKIGSELEKIIKNYNNQGYNIQIFIEEPSYIGGEETALLNAVEKKRTEPRIKPPYPAIAGLFGQPTIINNVETFYNVACVDDGSFSDKRFFCVYGRAEHPEVFHLPADWSIEKVLKETGNYPDFPFFVQIGGSAAGEVLDQNQLKNQTMSGAGGIEIYDKKSEPRKIILRWLSFYKEESCGKCTPCRIGVSQLHSLVENSKNIPWRKMFDLLETIQETAFCALGRSVSIPIQSYHSNVLKKK